MRFDITVGLPFLNPFVTLIVGVVYKYIQWYQYIQVIFYFLKRNMVSFCTHRKRSLLRKDKTKKMKLSGIDCIGKVCWRLQLPVVLEYNMYAVNIYVYYWYDINFLKKDKRMIGTSYINHLA